MPAGWQIVDLIGLEGNLEAARGQVVVNGKDREPVALPVDDIAVVLVGTSVEFSGAALHRLMGAGVAVMLCDWRGVPEGAAYSWSTHTRVGARQIAQASTTLPRRKNLWGRLVEAESPWVSFLSVSLSSDRWLG